MGPQGADISVDDGRTWAALPRAGFHTFSFAPNGRVGWGAGERGAVARLGLLNPPSGSSPHLISIIVPVFNESATVASVIERLLSIDLPAAREIIVVNDGSTDGTRLVLDGYREHRCSGWFTPSEIVARVTRSVSALPLRPVT